MKSGKIQRILSCAVFAVLLSAAVAMCANVLEYKEARIKYTPFHESSTNFDVIFLGTSHVWNHVLPMEMWKDYGIASYNWGYSNCTPAENYYLLQDILKETSPKVVVLDVYGVTEYESFHNGKYRTDRIEQQHVQFDSFPIWSLSKLRAARDVFDDYSDRIDFIWNFIMYHNRWSELGRSDFEYEITTEKGSRFLTGLGTGSFTPVGEDEKTTVSSVCYPYLLKTLDYCADRGIPVLCVYLPYGNCGKKQQKVAYSVGEDIRSYPGCTYVNMIDQGILNLDTDVCSVDDRHLNYSGAMKITDRLGQYLRDHYSLDDYSTNAAWQRDYEAYAAYKRSVLVSQDELVSCLVQLRDDDFRAELEVYDRAVMDSGRMKELFENAGITPVFTQRETDLCARLTVRDGAGEVVDDAGFVWGDTQGDVFGIRRAGSGENSPEETETPE